MNNTVPKRKLLNNGESTKPFNVDDWAGLIIGFQGDKPQLVVICRQCAENLESLHYIEEQENEDPRVRVYAIAEGYSVEELRRRVPPKCTHH